MINDMQVLYISSRPKILIFIGASSLEWVRKGGDLGRRGPCFSDDDLCLPPLSLNYVFNCNTYTHLIV
jgi:hypothetical protein